MDASCFVVDHFLQRFTGYESHTMAVAFNHRRKVQIKLIVKKHSDGYVAYPLGIKGVIGHSLAPHQVWVD